MWQTYTKTNMESKGLLDAWISCMFIGKTICIHFVGNVWEEMEFLHW